MTGSLRAQLVMLAATTCLLASAASSQEVVRAGVSGRAYAAVKPVRAGAAAAIAADGSIQGEVSSGRETEAVMIDHAKVMRLPERTQTVIIGNPIIADITIQRNGIVVVTGKSYGVTNLIALDAAGAMLAESLVSVQAATESVVVVQRGLERE